jgi:ferredoxin
MIAAVASISFRRVPPSGFLGLLDRRVRAVVGITATYHFDRSISNLEVVTVSRQVRVDPRLCEAHALCVDLAPDVFDLDDDDLATNDQTPDESRWDDVEAAIAACPRQAIGWVEE